MGWKKRQKISMSLISLFTFLIISEMILINSILQVELTGNSIYEYIHNYDQDEMNAILSLHPHMYQNPVSIPYNIIKF